MDDGFERMNNALGFILPNIFFDIDEGERLGFGEVYLC